MFLFAVGGSVDWGHSDSMEKPIDLLRRVYVPDARIDRQPLWPVDFPNAERLMWPALFPLTSPPAMGERAGWLAGAWASERLSLTLPPFAAVAGPGVCGRSLAQ